MTGEYVVNINKWSVLISQYFDYKLKSSEVESFLMISKCLSVFLILEDDIEVPKNFLKANDRWWKIKADIPADWDIIYLGIHNPIGKLVKPNILKLEHATQDEGNWGTHAYIFRHGALKDKVLPWLNYMIDALDLQLNIKFDDWNVYSIQPDIIKLNKKLAKKSTIQTM